MQTNFNDAQKLHDVLTRMAQLLNCSATCNLADCRRARRCVGTERRCVWTLPEQIEIAPQDVSEWRELERSRAQSLKAVRAAAIGPK